MRSILLRLGIRSASDSFSVLTALLLIMMGAFVDMQEGRRLSPCPEGATSTTDIYLDHLGLPRPTDTILRSVQPLRDGPLLFVGWGDEPTFVRTYYTLSYLSLPHRLGELGCGLSGRTPTVIVPGDDGDLTGVICHIISCGPGTTLVSPDLGIRSAREGESASKWQLFCQQ